MAMKFGLALRNFFSNVEKYRMLAQEVANSVLEPHEVSDVDVIHEHHTGEC